MHICIYISFHLHLCPLIQIERLKRKNRKLEEEHQDMTMRLNETTTTNMTTNIQEVSHVTTLTPLSFSNIDDISRLAFRSIRYAIKSKRWKANSNTTKKFIAAHRTSSVT